MKYIVNPLKSRLVNESVAVTSSTSKAAFNIKGMTLHSFAGVGLAIESKETLARRSEGRALIKSRWREVKVLVVDGISMIRTGII